MTIFDVIANGVFSVIVCSTFDAQLADVHRRTSSIENESLLPQLQRYGFAMGGWSISFLPPLLLAILFRWLFCTLMISNSGSSAEVLSVTSQA